MVHEVNDGDQTKGGNGKVVDDGSSTTTRASTGTRARASTGTNANASTGTRAKASTRASNVDFSFRYGINLAVLEHVCMVNNTAVFVYGSNHNDNDDGNNHGNGNGDGNDGSNDDHEHNTHRDHNTTTTTTTNNNKNSSPTNHATPHPTLLPSTLRTTLKLSYSGFHTHHPEYAGWRFIEKSVRDMPERESNDSKVIYSRPRALHPTLSSILSLLYV